MGPPTRTSAGREVGCDALQRHRQDREGPSLRARARSHHLRAPGVTFRGDNDTHRVVLEADGWQCNCHYFESWKTCAHILALQKILGVMLPENAQTSLFPVAATADEASGSSAAGPIVPELTVPPVLADVQRVEGPHPAALAIELDLQVQEPPSSGRRFQAGQADHVLQRSREDRLGARVVL